MRSIPEIDQGVNHSNAAFDRHQSRRLDIAQLEKECEKHFNEIKKEVLERLKLRQEYYLLLTFISFAWLKCG
jgi:hypothetical protein